MDSFATFNDAMRSFLEDLTEVFPDVDAVRASIDSFEAVLSVDYKKPRTVFRDVIFEHVSLVADRDDRLFERVRVSGIDFKSLWESDITDETKSVLWSHLARLTVLSVK